MREQKNKMDDDREDKPNTRDIIKYFGALRDLPDEFWEEFEKGMEKSNF